MGTCTKLIIQDVNFGKTPTNIISGTRRDVMSTSTLRRRITVDIQLNGINTLHPLSPLSPLDIAIHPLDMRINLMEMIMNPLSTRIQSEDMDIKPVNVGINGTHPQLREPTINQRHLTRNRKRLGRQDQQLEACSSPNPTRCPWRQPCHPFAASGEEPNTTRTPLPGRFLDI
jgi:hypothetical protein